MPTRNGNFARWTCLLTRKCTVHTCIYAQENNARGRGHLWLNATRTRVIYGYASVRASSDASFMGISKQLAKKRRELEATCGRQREVPFMAHHGKRTNSRNKRRSQGRPNVRWPAQTLGKYAKTHKQHEKGETRLRRAHKRAAPGKLKTRGMHHSENKQQCCSTKNVPRTEGR